MPNLSKLAQPRFWTRWERAASVEPSFSSLFEKLENDIWYDCHPNQVAFRRSYTKRKLVKMGPRILPALARHLWRRFPDMNTAGKEMDEVDWNMFGVWVWLICSIRDEFRLPGSPYGPSVRFGDQNMSEWYDFCLNCAKVQ